MNDHVRTVAALTDAQLTAQMEALAARDRNINAMLIIALAEFDARKLHRGLGSSSLHVYCMCHLRLSEFAAFNRIAIELRCRTHNNDEAEEHVARSTGGSGEN